MTACIYNRYTQVKKFANTRIMNLLTTMALLVMHVHVSRVNDYYYKYEYGHQCII